MLQMLHISHLRKGLHSNCESAAARASQILSEFHVCKEDDTRRDAGKNQQRIVRGFKQFAQQESHYGRGRASWVCHFMGSNIAGSFFWLFYQDPMRLQ